MAGRVLYRDIVSYETPTSLDALHGPARECRSCRSRCIGPRWVSDLDRPGLRRAAYRAIVREGSSEVQ